MANKVSAIYGFKNTVSGKWYIGQSINYHSRKNAHVRFLNSGKHWNSHLQAAWSKYGLEAFEWVLLEECSQEMLDVRETAWIAYYRSNETQFGYNRDSGGKFGKKYTFEARQKVREGIIRTGASNSEENKKRLREMNESRRGIPLPEEQRKRIAAGNMGKVRSEEANQKFREKRKGMKFPPEWCANIVKSKKGIRPSEETRAKLSAARKGKRPSKESIEKCRQSNLGKKRDPEGHRKQWITRRLNKLKEIPLLPGLC